MGHIIMTVLGMVAQMERHFIKERQHDGIERAKVEGVYHGGKRRPDRDRAPRRVLIALGGPLSFVRSPAEDR